jgi:hypothetical protein
MCARVSIAVSCGLTMLVACGGQPSPQKKPAEAIKPAAPQIPPGILTVAREVLGSEAEVLAFGDLARSGNQQVLAIHRLAKTPDNTVPGILLLRAVVIENDTTKWKEVLRCDEHLKNPSGYLGATPIAPVTGWRLQYEQHPQRGLQLYFTPLAMPGAAHVPTIGVRWNPEQKRYQSLDRNFEHFLGEAPSLERINSRLR